MGISKFIIVTTIKYWNPCRPVKRSLQKEIQKVMLEIIFMIIGATIFLVALISYTLK